LNTAKTGQFDHQFTVTAEEPLSGDPTTGCAQCGSLKLAILSTDASQTLLLCADCRSISKLALEEFAAGDL
jgi:hypothetical protein